MSSLGEIPNLGPPLTRSDYEADFSESSGQKRRRDSSPISSTFLQSAKNFISQRSNVDVCWNCGAPRTELCHVVAKADLAYRAMSVKGMLSFGHLGDYRNAIALCCSCHTHFNRNSFTGWVFLPAYMDFSIDWERDDFAKREKTFEQTGKRIERKFPDEEDYEHHLRMRNILTDPDDGLCRGGLYDTYILEPIFPPMMMAVLQKAGLSVPGRHPRGAKRWHGAPMAAINRGFVVTGAPWMKLPEEMWENLRQLQRLYTRELPQMDSFEAESMGGIPGNAIAQTSEQDKQASGLLSQHDVSSAMAKSAAATRVPNEFGGRHGAMRRPAASFTDDDVDSAAGMCSRKKRKGKNEQSDALYEDGCEDPIVSAELLRREELGILEDTWCFGPQSDSNDKVRKFTGRII